MPTFCRATLYYHSGASLEVDVRDGRAADLPGWEECGFELVPHSSAVRDWLDDDEVSRVHYPEIEELARKLSGCDVALVSGHIKRSPSDARRHRDLSPITYVHSDFAAGYDGNIRDSYRMAS